MSPFVQITIGDFSWKSTVSDHAGKEPTWGVDEAFQYNVVDDSTQMVVEVRDYKALAQNSLIGRA